MILEEEYVDGQLLGYGRLQALQYNGERAGDAFAVLVRARRRAAATSTTTSGRAMHGGWLRTPLRYDHISSAVQPAAPPSDPEAHRAAPGHRLRGAARAPPCGPRRTAWSRSRARAARTATWSRSSTTAATRPTTRTCCASRAASSGRARQAAPDDRRRRVDRALDRTAPALRAQAQRALPRSRSQLNGPGKPLPEAQLPKFKRRGAAQARRSRRSRSLQRPRPRPRRRRRRHRTGPRPSRGSDRSVAAGRRATRRLL